MTITQRNKTQIFLIMFIYVNFLWCTIHFIFIFCMCWLYTYLKFEIYLYDLFTKLIYPCQCFPRRMWIYVCWKNVLEYKKFTLKITPMWLNPAKIERIFRSGKCSFRGLWEVFCDFVFFYVSLYKSPSSLDNKMLIVQLKICLKTSEGQFATVFKIIQQSPEFRDTHSV